MSSSSMPPSLLRCPWSTGSALYAAYHDDEWGLPVHDDRVFFEFLVLEGAQAGLSWSTILNKREGYRAAFAGFDPARVARFDARTIERLMANPAIVRNRLKIAERGEQCQGVSRAAARVRHLRSICVVVCRRQAGAESSSFACGGPRTDGAVRRAVGRSAQARVPLRRVDHHVCLHAGDRSRQRSPRRLSALGRRTAIVIRA